MFLWRNKKNYKPDTPSYLELCKRLIFVYVNFCHRHKRIEINSFQATHGYQNTTLKKCYDQFTRPDRFKMTVHVYDMREEEKDRYIGTAHSHFEITGQWFLLGCIMRCCVCVCVCVGGGGGGGGGGEGGFMKK